MSVAEIEIAELELEQPTGGLWNEAWYRLTHNWGALGGAAIVGIFVICALFAPLIAPSHPSVSRTRPAPNGTSQTPDATNTCGMSPVE